MRLVIARDHASNNNDCEDDLESLLKVHVQAVVDRRFEEECEAFAVIDQAKHGCWSGKPLTHAGTRLFLIADDDCVLSCSYDNTRELVLRFTPKVHSLHDQHLFVDRKIGQLKAVVVDGKTRKPVLEFATQHLPSFLVDLVTNSLV